MKEIVALFSLKGRRAVVTGSSRGIGREILITLARAGAEVVAHGISEGDAARKVVADCGEIGAAAHFVPGDLSVPGGGREFAETVLQKIGPADIVVLNASLQIRRAWDEIPSDEAEVQMRTNFHASLEILQVLVPPMREKKWGRVLAIGSVQQAKPHPAMIVYSASKAAQMNMVLSLAKQLAPDGITVNNLAPGVILTDRNTGPLADEGYARKVKAAIPANFFGEVGDCAGAALLLCSEEGRYITGQNLYADGGMSL